MTLVTVTDGSRLITVSPQGKNVYVGTVMDPPIFYLGHSIRVTAGDGGINAYQVVIIDPVSEKSIPADGTNETHAGLVVGMAKADIAEDATGLVQISSEIENADWDLDPGEIYYLGVAGTISKTPPVTGFWQKIGVAKDATKLILNLGEPIKVI